LADVITEILGLFNEEAAPRPGYASSAPETRRFLMPMKFVPRSILAAALFMAIPTHAAYWKPAVSCSDTKGGEMVVDVDAADRRQVQLVVHNKEIIDYLTHVPYGFHVSDVQYFDGGKTAAFPGRQGNPVFQGGDFHGFENKGSIGGGVGWYVGDNIYRNGDTVVFETVNNYWQECPGHDQDGVCLPGPVHPREIVRNWIFTGCRNLGAN
jgi:hypothetical protein